MQKWHRNCTINTVKCSQDLGASRAHFHCRSKKVQNHIQHHLDLANMLQESLKKEFERLQEQQIATLLDLDKTTKCNSFIIVTKPNGTVHLCLDPTCLNQMLIRSIHGGPTISDIYPKLTNSMLHNVNRCKFRLSYSQTRQKSFYLTTFACQFGRFRFTRLPFGVVPVGEMFQWNIDNIFEELPNVFSIADDILIVGYHTNGRDHNRTMRPVMKICCQKA